MLVVAEQEATRRFLHEQAAYVHPPSFVDGAEWYAAGMAVCAFLQDLAQLCSPAPPAPQADEVKNMLRQIDAFSCSMRRSWGGK